MTSDRRWSANRGNAMRSTGPRTPGGKARASANALRHGLAAAALPAETVARTAQLAAVYRALLGDAAAAQHAAEAQAQLQRVKAAKLHVLQLALAQLRSATPEATPAALESAALLQTAAELRKLSEYERKARSRLKTMLHRK